MRWSPEDLSEADRLYASGLRGRLLAVELTKRLGRQITPDAVKQARSRQRDLAALSGAAPCPSPSDNLDATQECQPVFAQPEETKVAQAEPVVNAPAVHTSKTRGEAYLVISDRQEPYSAKGALAFLLAVAKEYGVNLNERGRVYDVGDEVDFLCFSKFLRSPEAPHTVNQELEEVRTRIARWRRALPHVRVCRSNHADRLVKRAAEAGLPSQVLRAHHEILGDPQGWEWADNWIVEGSKHRFLVQHGHEGPQSISAGRQRPAFNGISTVWGHQHSQPLVAHVNTSFQRVWSMCVGSLIDREEVAFAYGKGMTWQPWIGCGVVLDGGRTPVLIPFGSV